MHERNNSLWPAILGGVGYVIYPPGALVLGERPIIAAADIELSIEPDEMMFLATHQERFSSLVVGRTGTVSQFANIHASLLRADLTEINPAALLAALQLSLADGLLEG